MATLPRFDNAQILVVGDLMLDRYWHGSTSRVSPEAPVPVVKVEHQQDRVGGAGNVGLNIAALGAGVRVVGVVGRDEAAGVLKSRLEAAGIQALLIEAKDKATITKLRVISRQQQLLRLDFEDAYSADDAAGIVEQVEQLLPQVQAIVLSDYAKGALHAPGELIALARAANIPVLVDPKGDDFSRYAGATLLTPNIAELEAVVGVCASEAELSEKGLALIEELGLEALLVTRGEKGMTLLRPEHKELHLPARAREVYDVTGAGDTVIAVLAAALTAGEDFPEAVTLANLAASIVVGKSGTAAVSAPELRRALQLEKGSERGVVNATQLLADLEDARSGGEKIVFTNGCFDLLHAGHVAYLEQARTLGDRLVVAVNSDDSVRKLKGEGRPINTVDRRMAVLAGLEAVDWVVAFADDTPEALLAVLKPDILVKGGDYDKEGVVGWEIVEAYGGEVRALNLVDDCSTTAMVEKIQATD
ncbi:MAG: bifunctional D-glycero-beta-D-manno-heptose-7-phosphate kinase/D-glycero-beta-D-manno-heptose 1-phosphate adenylyltransferase HldE [Porticoccaceae bacterium]|nr:bifunctional D-glycero-beta-D-manno-heptose-7-phosphate kinase/D-glycero-beta-D-manno-heptose 1-phosphate adenylyltransferase HldE [Porticoccaceae bacterium]